MRYSSIAAILCAFSLFPLAAGAFAQRLVVTAEGRHGAAAPLLMKDDVSVEVNKSPAAIDEWIPLRGAELAWLELYIVIDDGDDTELGVQFNSLKAFMNAQPDTTWIGLAYLRNGAANIVAPLSKDHAETTKALRLPMGQAGIAASPYVGISDLVKKWPADGTRHEILLISSGIDPWSPPDPANPYLHTAIVDAQGRGVLVHSIYYGAEGHLGHSYSRINWGQNYLSELGDATGGEAYWQGFGNPVSFDAYLKDLAERLQNQYLLSVKQTDAKSGLQPVRVMTGNSHVSLVSASMIYLPK
jgi:hypothetical protein